MESEKDIRIKIINDINFRTKVIYEISRIDIIGNDRIACFYFKSLIENLSWRKLQIYMLIVS